MKKKGSILIVVLIILAGVEMLSLIYIGVIKSFSTSAKHSKAVDIALYNANEGVNSVMNILMRDADWDFRTGPDGNPYTFDFDTMDFKVQRLDANTNPITVVTGNPDNSFNPTTYSIWIKCTGFYYPQNKPDLYKSDPTKYGHLVKKRTIITKIGAAIPFNPFNAAITACGSVSSTNAISVDGKICATDGISGGVSVTDPDTSSCSLTPDDCAEGSDLKDAIKDWAKDICSESTTRVYEEDVQLVTAFANNPENVNANKELEGNYCFKENVTKWAGNVGGVDTIDDGDGDFSDPGEVPPPVMVIYGNLTMTGTPDFDGIIIVMGDTDVNKLSGNESFAGSILSFNSVKLGGNAGMAYKDFSKYMNLNKNRVSRSEYYIADKPIRMKIDTTEYNVIIADLNPPN